MMKSKNIFVVALAVITVILTACEKLPLQKTKKYETSFFQNNLNKSVLDFMESRTDIFTGMLDAIDYVDEDPAFNDVKKAFQSDGNTFLLLADQATIALPSTVSYFGVNLVDDDNNPVTPMTAATSWRQYPREQIANLLRYHIVKGKRDFPNLTSTARWFDTFAISATNDSAKVRIFMTNDRDGGIRINDYLGAPAVSLPRTPNLYATNGVVHVLNVFLRQPTRLAITNNR
ncbi:MAG: fasciclin domain-containing protein [Oligoflexus sp.]|nr:fasciclin domain-containing protein [Pseudopedobacter sp.]